ACEGNPAQCFIRRNLSSSAAAMSLPSRTSAAEESAWKAFRPRIIIALPILLLTSLLLPAFGYGKLSRGADDLIDKAGQIHQLWIVDLGPVESRDNGASHDPILVLLRQERQFLGEMGNALTVRSPVETVGDVGPPIAALRAISVEQPPNMWKKIAERV